MVSLLEGFNFWKISEHTIFGQEQYTVFNAEKCQEQYTVFNAEEQYTEFNAEEWTQALHM